MFCGKYAVYKDINKINSYLCIVNHARQTYPYGAVDH